jgi:hypothetical protein
MTVEREAEMRFDMAMAHLDPEMWWRAEIHDHWSLNRLFHPDQRLEELPLFQGAGLEFLEQVDCAGKRDA